MFVDVNDTVPMISNPRLYSPAQPDQEVTYQGVFLLIWEYRKESWQWLFFLPVRCLLMTDAVEPKPVQKVSCSKRLR